MMATEATSETIATSSTIPDYELSITETSSQDASPIEQHLVNGTATPDKDENKQDTGNVETSVNSAEVSVSGGSDTETTKAETSKGQVDEKGHARTASTVAKKPISFKPVSVNKTFLAAKGAAVPPVSKLGEKSAPGVTATQTGPSVSTAARPRLVAKSGNGLRDSIPRNSTPANGTKAGSAPDASAVWNKNRPAAPPEPKRFTDEELKQRYGIHLATRLQTDEPGGKEKNWADIDDDDDDWAPDTIEWTDGTKITLPQADEALPAPEPTLEPTLAPTPVPIAKEIKPIEVPKSKSPAPPQTTASPTVKPSGFGSGRAGLVLKGATEKPTLVAKPPGPPTPVKSPWAALPPVDKVAPVAIEIPQTQQQSRFGQKDPHGFQAMPPPPTKEIAADDFSRPWRDNSSTSNRELYNSQSGRYEPVIEGRRGSTRNDAHSRQPAVLQRPQQDGPAEPSAAFQTHRASGQEAGYGRRRTSSNVSGGSGNFARRMSRGHETPLPHELRRGSLAALSDAPSSPRAFSPSGQHPNQRNQPQHQPWQSRTSPIVSHPSPQSAHGQLAASTSGSVDGQSALTSAPSIAFLSEDQIFEEQKKRMQLARETAIKRRQEEEAREEAAKRERIRIKLEAMGPPPETQKSKKDTPKQEKAMPVQIQARETTKSPAPPKATEKVDEAKMKPSSNEPVHEVVTATIGSDSKPSDKPSSPEQLPTNGIHEAEATQATPARRNDSQDVRPSQPWQNNTAPGSGRYQAAQGPWAPPAQQPTSRNVWGPPTNDRTLGNGTFNPELSRMHSTHPGPIGPPNHNRNSQFPPGRGREPFDTRPSPIGPPNRALEEQRQQVKNSGWHTVADKIQDEEKAEREKQEKEAVQRKELEANSLNPEPAGLNIKETFRPTILNEDGSRGRLNPRKNAAAPSSLSNPSWNSYPPKGHEESLARTTFDEQEAARRRHIEAMGNTPQQQFPDAWRAAPNVNASSRVRDSRFFPNNRDVRLEDATTSFDRPGSPSPPPPTEPGHPAYDGDSAHPLVSLPRPLPVVKLPPPVLAPIGPPKPVSFAAAVLAPAVPASHGPVYPVRHDYPSRAAASHQDVRRAPEASSGGWQDRINHLIGRKNSPPKSHALAVDSSSKNALELPHSQLSATVSLPSSPFASISADNGSVISKLAAREECFEEQEMGSTPKVTVPRCEYQPWQPLERGPPRPLPKKFHVADAVSTENADKFEEDIFPKTISHNNIMLHVRFPWEESERLITGPAQSTTRQGSNPRQGSNRGRGPRQPSSSAPRGGRGNYSSPSEKPVTSSHSPARGGHRGGRGFNNNWNRHVSTPTVQT